jgi:hypothetical protein
LVYDTSVAVAVVVRRKVVFITELMVSGTLKGFLDQRLKSVSGGMESGSGLLRVVPLDRGEQCGHFGI